ncbi:hypothetical protein ESZ50_01255 [Weissella muntiaci]|uniref:Uncharacterized protein n=1 Tax=Weissella muntiaci TaxID=2508881 RepID=A0A6C2CB79_9LACO|nr:hypothetical protein [Weissella muntiaci]TYC50872.1 hypothetical protein ESZ50_01255 [Weissella muntiaci]
MAKYKVQINDPERGLSWVTDEFKDDDGALVDVGSAEFEIAATLYDKSDAEYVAEFLRDYFTDMGIDKRVEVVE